MKILIIPMIRIVILNIFHDSFFASKLFRPCCPIDRLQVSQNHPNPFDDHTTINVYLPSNEITIISICDVLGREVAHYENMLNSGSHSFVFYSGMEKYYFLSVKTNDDMQSINMLNTGSSTGSDCKIVHVSSTNITNRNLFILRIPSQRWAITH